MKNKKEIKEFILASIGILLLVLSINFISWKYQIVSGGMPGYALAANFMWGIPIGLTLFIVNSIILLMSLLILGKGAGIKGIYGYILISFLIEFTRNFFNIQQVDLATPIIQIILVTIQGLTAPIGIALVLQNGYSFGSWSSLYPIINKFYKKLEAPLFFFMMDITLTVIVTLTFGWFKGLLLCINSIVFFFAFKWIMNMFKAKKEI